MRESMNKLPTISNSTINRVMLLVLVILFTGCASLTHRGYKPFVRDLDGKSELEISMYPADYGKTKTSIPLIYDSSETHDEVYFQVFVRGKKEKSGPNPHIQSILIESFFYRIDDGPRRQLLSKYASGFWMQDNPRYEKRKLPPIPYKPASVVTVEINLTLNGKAYSFEGEMPASEKTTVHPLALEMLQ